MNRNSIALTLVALLAVTACGNGDNNSNTNTENNAISIDSSAAESALPTSEDTQVTTDSIPGQTQDPVPAQDQDSSSTADQDPDAAQEQDPPATQDQQATQDQDPVATHDQDPTMPQDQNIGILQDPHSASESDAVPFDDPQFELLRDNVNPNFAQSEFEFDLTQGDTITVDFSATDPNGSIPFFELFENSKELGATIVDNGDGTGQFQWKSLPDQLGNYRFSVRAVDADVAASVANFTSGLGISGATLSIEVKVKSRCDDQIGSSVLTINCLNGTNGFAIATPQFDVPISYVPLKTAGDFNGDGYADYILPYDTILPNGTILSVDDTDPVTVAKIILGTADGWQSGLDLTDLSSAQAITLLNRYTLPNAIEHIGDINADGYSDIAMAYRSNIRIVFGRSTIPTDGLNTDQESEDIGLNIGKDRTASAISKISPVGDFNGDGLNDFIIGYEGYYNVLEVSDPFIERNNGAIFVIYGRKQFPSELNYEQLDQTDAFTVVGPTKDSDLGTNVQMAGDIDGDGFSDFIATDFNQGVGYIVYGSENPAGDDLVLGEIDQPNTTKIVSLDREIISPGTEFDADLGFPDGGRINFLGGGDFNADGFSDFTFTNKELIDAGKLLVVLGKNDRYPSTIDLRDPTAFNGFEVQHAESQGGNAESIRAADISADLNGDQVADLLMVSSSYVYESKETSSAYVLYGTTNVRDRKYGETGAGIGRLVYSDSFSFTEEIDAKSMGDINGDGVNDIVIRLSQHTNRKPASYVIFGTRD